MTLIITELAIQANGTMAVEIFNTGSVAVDTTVTFVSLQTVNGGNGPIAAFDPAVIPPGGVLTVGHSSIPGLDQNPSDSVFASTPFQSLILVQDSVVDNLGQVGGTNLGTDVVYEGLTSRAPDPDFNSNNLGDFSQTSGFSNNSLGTAVCFATGTQIATPDGSIAVEDLVIGDLIRNAEGGAMPVRWIGRQTLVKRFAGDAARLVRVAAGALGAEQDLYLTADHGLVLDGYVVNASALVDGDGVTWVSLDDTPKRQTVYHVETAEHGALIANGVVAETYLDQPGRRAFDNYAEYIALYGDEQPIAENPMPRITSARLLPPSLVTARARDVA